jgi:hypothetical protein
MEKRRSKLSEVHPLTPSKISIVGIGVSNCNPNDNTCNPGKVLNVHALPAAFYVLTHSDATLNGAAIDFEVQIQDISTGNTLHSIDWTSTIGFPDQQDASWYDAQHPAPPSLTGIAAGRHKIYGYVATSDGQNFAEFTSLVTTQ